MTDDESQARADVWLWRARFFKTRALSGAQIAKRGLRIGRHGEVRRTSKPGARVAVGDILTFAAGARIHTIEVLALGERRGPAEEARSLYRMIDGEA